MIRPIDELGRICIPKEWRTQLGIESRENVVMSLNSEDESISIKKQVDYFKCPFCGETDTSKLTYFKKSQICIKCKSELGK